MKEKLAFVLAVKILELIKESGANQTEAKCALQVAEAMIPEADLQVKPSGIYQGASAALR